MAGESNLTVGELTAGDALIVVDVQKDFCSKGALAVPDGEKVVPVINRIQDLFATVIFTRDWHPPSHVSFSTDPQFVDGSWPRHCVAGSQGAAFHPQLHVPLYARVIDKATHKDRESYSAFDVGEFAEDLRAQQIDRLFVAGLATNYCVKFTVLAGLKEAFRMVVIADACRGIDIPPGSVQKSLDEMTAAGALVINSSQLPRPG